jgi:hypothetical protein
MLVIIPPSHPLPDTQIFLAKGHPITILVYVSQKKFRESIFFHGIALPD